MTSIRIVFLDRGTLGPDIKLPAPACQHQWVDYEKTESDEVVDRLQGATVAVTNKVPIREETLLKLPDLRLIAVAATGTDIVDLDACAARGVTVTNVSNYAEQSVAEHVFALVFALRRRIVSYRQRIESGDWQKSEQFWFYDGPTEELAGSTLGIVGTGALACSTARLGRAFGMNVLHHSLSGRSNFAHGELVDLESLLTRSNTVSIHCPLTPASIGLFGKTNLERMRRDAILINTARGGIVVLDELVRALRIGRLAGAGIDVAPVEPPAPDDPVMTLNSLPNAIVTPHAAWSSNRARQRLAGKLIETIDQHVQLLK